MLETKIFKNGRHMRSPEVDSRLFHNITHLDTEILGMFCDYTKKHGDDLKKILIDGYMYQMGVVDK